MLWLLGKQKIERLGIQPQLFFSESNAQIDQVFDALQNASIKTVELEIIFGRIYDHIGFNAIQAEWFSHLVIARLAFP